jgi:hypothetical protein
MIKLVLISLLTLSSLSIFASDVSETKLNQLQILVKAKLNETREMEQGLGYCEDSEDGKVKCTWYIEDTGRTPDTMTGVFTLVGSEFILIDAYEEYGC